jgi:scyllo-inositol 2-dehydrogenase (NADP+)
MTKQNRGAIRTGIIGLGRAGWDIHVKAMREMPRKFKIVAVCDPLTDRLKKASDEFGCRTYTDVKALLADSEVELVTIANRSVDHYTTTQAVLKAGKHVYVEKPMCLTYAEARRLKTLATKSKGNLFVGHNRRFDNDFCHILNVIKSGVLGEIFQFRITRAGFNCRDDWQALKEFGGGMLLNWGPHVIDHALQMLEAPVESQWSALKQVVAAGDAEDHAVLTLRGTNGRLGLIEISSANALTAPVWQVCGTRGGLSCDGQTLTLRYVDPKQKLGHVDARRETPDGYGSAVALRWIEKTLPVKPSKSAGIWGSLYDSIRKARAFPITLDEAVEVMRLVSQCKKGTRFEAASSKR